MGDASQGSEPAEHWEGWLALLRDARERQERVVRPLDGVAERLDLRVDDVAEGLCGVIEPLEGVLEAVPIAGADVGCSRYPSSNIVGAAECVSDAVTGACRSARGLLGVAFIEARRVEDLALHLPRCLGGGADFLDVLGKLVLCGSDVVHNLRQSRRGLCGPAVNSRVPHALGVLGDSSVHALKLRLEELARESLLLCDAFGGERDVDGAFLETFHLREVVSEAARFFHLACARSVAKSASDVACLKLPGNGSCGCLTRATDVAYALPGLRGLRYGLSHSPCFVGIEQARAASFQDALVYDDG